MEFRQIDEPFQILHSRDLVALEVQQGQARKMAQVLYLRDLVRVEVQNVQVRNAL